MAVATGHQLDAPDLVGAALVDGPPVFLVDEGSVSLLVSLPPALAALWEFRVDDLSSLPWCQQRTHVLLELSLAERTMAELA